jgi:transposase
MTGHNRRNFSHRISPRIYPVCSRTALHHSVATAVTELNVGQSTMDKWVRQLKEERGGKSPRLRQ